MTYHEHDDFADAVTPAEYQTQLALRIISLENTVSSLRARLYSTQTAIVVVAATVFIFELLGILSTLGGSP